MDFEYIPKMNAKERFTYYIDCEEAFYSFVEEFNLIGVNWYQPTTFSSSYFFRLLQEGASARAHGYGKKTIINQMMYQTICTAIICPF